MKHWRQSTVAALRTLLVALPLLVACESAQYTLTEGSGRHPALPPPADNVIPTINLSPAKPWPDDTMPVPAGGLAVNAFASGFTHPRWLYVLPNGDVLVADTNAPEHDKGMFGAIAGFVVGIVKRIIGTAVKSPDRIMLLRDGDGDGVAEQQWLFLDDIRSPFGMALVDDDLYVAATDQLLRFDYERGATSLSGAGDRVIPLPANPPNYHWTRNVIASLDGKRLYVTVGSNSDHGEEGLAAEKDRATVLEVDRATGDWRVFAAGLRNPNGLAWEPETGALWTTVNERDHLGSDIVPDYMTSLSRGDFFGWPWIYFGDHIDPRVEPQRPDLLARTRVPDFALGPHTSSMGLVFYEGADLPPRYQGGAFIAQHGSYNRRPKSGYKVIFVPFENGAPSGPPEDVLTGFLATGGSAWGRPVGLAVAADGALLVADDVGHTVWRVSGR